MDLVICATMCCNFSEREISLSFKTVAVFYEFDYSGGNTLKLYSVVVAIYIYHEKMCHQLYAIITYEQVHK